MLRFCWDDLNAIPAIPLGCKMLGVADEFSMCACVGIKICDVCIWNLHCFYRLNLHFLQENSPFSICFPGPFSGVLFVNSAEATGKSKSISEGGIWWAKLGLLTAGKSWDFGCSPWRLGSNWFRIIRIQEFHLQNSGN